MLRGKRLEFMVVLLERFAKDYNSSQFAIFDGALHAIQFEHDNLYGTEGVLIS